MFDETFTRGDDKHGNVITPVVLRIKRVITKAQTIRFRLTSEVERFDGRIASRTKKLQIVAVPFDLEELPNGAHFHICGRFTLHILHGMEELQRLRIALRQQLLEVPLETKMPAVEHEGVDVAPNLRQVRYRANPAVQIRSRRDGYIGVDLRAAPLAGRHRNNFALYSSYRHLPEDVLRQDLLPQLGVHDLVHEAKPRHRIFRVKRRGGVIRTN